MSAISAPLLAACLAAITACGGDLALPGGTAPGGDPPTGPVGPSSPSVVAADDRFVTVEGGDQTLSVPSPGVLANDRVDGAAGASLEAALVQEPSHGRLDLKPDGSLDYTPDSDWFGEDRFTYRAAAGSASAPAEVVIDVASRNDSPRFTAGPDQQAKRDKKTREVEVPGWATDIRPGPANEADQSVSFLVTVVDGARSLAETPTVSSSGTLRYTPSKDQGTARVEVRLRDDGGTANGGSDTSQPHILIISVEH